MFGFRKKATFSVHRREGLGPEKEHVTDEDYFNDEDVTPGVVGGAAGGTDDDDEDDEDPLDAFMAGIEDEIKGQKDKKRVRAVREDIEQEDDQETYFKAMANAPIVVMGDEEEAELEYDSDGYPLIPESSKVIDPLPPVNHDEIEYLSFNRDFYEEHSNIAALTGRDVFDIRKKLGIKASGYAPPKPCISFAHFGFDRELMTLIQKSEFTQPTPIQSQAIPAALCGRDVIGIAQTGSGKTVAYLWPLLVHCIDQSELQEGDGPIGLICAPTRELCQQIYHEARKFARAYNLSVCCVYGGGSRWEQSKAMKEGCEILVATPGRLIDLVKSKVTNLRRVTYLVFDEADRMFDMGFETQVRSIANHVRPDRQTLLFSATFKKRIERLCRDALCDPVRVVIGGVGEASTDITQVVEVMADQLDKWPWLLAHLVEFTSAGSVLVFVTRKLNSEEVASALTSEGHHVGLLHGDMSQGDRDTVITSFKKKEFPVLVATDVAARGLDIPAIKTVVNYDVAKDIDTHVHRIGRTGRAGEKGTAFTLVNPKDIQFAGDLVRNLEVVGQTVPENLLQLAMQNSRFRKSRSKPGGGGRGRGRARPGLGATPETMAKARPGLGAPVETVSKGKKAGPGANRTSFVKESLQAQYKMRFQAASSSSLSSTSSVTAASGQIPSEGAPPPKKRKSRWD